MAVGPMHAGFILPDLPLVVLTDAEIFNRYRRRRRKVFKEGVVIEDFTTLRGGTSSSISTTASPVRRVEAHFSG